MINEYAAKGYCKEDLSLIENYNKAVTDTTQVWDCHHRLEIQDDIKLSKKELIDNRLYYQRPANELIFLTHSDHVKLHNAGKRNPMYGKKLSEKARKKVSLAGIGRIPWNKGKPAWNKGMQTDKNVCIKLSNAKKGNHWWNNGYKEIHCKECPGKDWIRGRIKKVSQK